MFISRQIFLISRFDLMRLGMFVLIGLLFIGTVHIISPQFRMFFRLASYIPIILIVGVTFRKYKSLKLSWAFIILIAYVFFYFVSAMVGNDLLQGIAAFINGPFLMFMMICSLIIYYKEKSFRDLLVISLFFSTILALVSFAILFNLLHVNYYSYQYNELIDSSADMLLSRATGVYSNPNTLGMLFSLQIALLCFYLRVVSGNLIKKFSVVLLVLAILGVIATASRASILMALLVVAIYIFSGTNLKKKIYFIFGLFCLAALSIQVIDYDFLIQRFSSDSLTGRDEIWRDAFAVLSRNTYFGLGPGQYKFKDANGVLFSAHNYYINLLVETGIFATLFFILFLIFLVVFSFKRVVFGRGNDAAMQFCYAYFVGLFAHQFFEVSGFNPYGIQGILFVMAAAYVCYKASVKNLKLVQIKGSRIGISPSIRIS